jgi:hypothetical protein
MIMGGYNSENRDMILGNLQTFLGAKQIYF